MKVIRDTLSGLWSLIVGLKITGVEFFRPHLTTHYPRQEVVNLGTYRGHIELVAQDGDPNLPRCVMCGTCVENCPSRCLNYEMHVEGDEPGPPAAERRELLLGLDVSRSGSGPKSPPPDKIVRVLDAFHLNYNLCSLCGLCVQNCPVASLAFSRDSYLAGTKRQNFEYELVSRMKARAAGKAGTQRAAA